MSSWRTRLLATLGRREKTVETLARRLIADWYALDDIDRQRVRALALHVIFRVEQEQYAPLEVGDHPGATILTNAWVRELLRASGATFCGERAARQCIAAWKQLGLVRDTGDAATPSGQPSRFHSFWYPVYEIRPIASARQATRWRFRTWRGARATALPHQTASLSAWLVRKGLIPRRPSGSRFSPGSVQWAFWHTGPP